jgi:hypothetical protein
VIRAGLTEDVWVKPVSEIRNNKASRLNIVVLEDMQISDP